MVCHADRPRDVGRALRLGNVLEGIISVTAAIAANSVALLGFGIDSFAESASAGVLIWRLGAERNHGDPERVEEIERHAQQVCDPWVLARLDPLRIGTCQIESG
jgi:hypothetical protein